MNIVERVDDHVPIQHALVSVSDKSGLDHLIPALTDVNPAVQIYATGGTHAAIAENLGPDRAVRHLIRVSDYTGQPETQGGLVKTLDFKIYLGLLTETDNAAHQADLERTGAVPIDMVVANLYPFQEVVAQEDVTLEQARAHIDIGGPCMIRAAAKNFLRVAAVVDPADYGWLVERLRAQGGALSLAARFELARKAFAHTAAYDRAISDFLARQADDAPAATYTVE